MTDEREPVSDDGTTQVELLFFDGCPTHHATAKLVDETIERLGIDASVTEVNVRSDEEAERREFLGSPSVRVDGEDIEPSGDAPASYGRRCRVYDTPDGLQGVPPVAMLEAALTGEPYASAQSGDPGKAADCCSESQETTVVTLLIADWCPQCPAVRKFWEELHEQEDFTLEVVDIESARGSELAEQHGIRAVPATVIDGVVEFRDVTLPARSAALARLN